MDDVFGCELDLHEEFDWMSAWRELYRFPELCNIEAWCGTASAPSERTPSSDDARRSASRIQAWEIAHFPSISISTPQHALTEIHEFRRNQPPGHLHGGRAKCTTFSSPEEANARRGEEVARPGKLIADDMSLTCQLCADQSKVMSFTRPQHLKRHINAVHLRIKPYTCNCKKTFSRKDNMRQHQKGPCPRMRDS